MRRIKTVILVAIIQSCGCWQGRIVWPLFSEQHGKPITDTRHMTEDKGKKAFRALK